MTKNSSPILLNLPNLVLIVHFVFCIQKLKRPFHNACIFQQTLKLNIRLVLKNNKKTKKFRTDFHCWWLKMKVWKVLEKKLLLPQCNLEENLPTKWKHKNKCRPIIVTFNGSYLDLQFENVFDVHNFSYLVIDSLVLSMLAEGLVLIKFSTLITLGSWPIAHSQNKLNKKKNHLHKTTTIFNPLMELTRELHVQQPCIFWFASII
jgi:hypothetical protein